jgi:hypothetical protein
LGIGGSLSIRKLSEIAAAFVVGALVGFVVELLRQVSEEAHVSMIRFERINQSFASLEQRVSFLDAGVEMLLRCPRHGDLLNAMLRRLLKDGVFATEGDYLTYLGRAIENSDEYQGVQPCSLRSFKDFAAYLDELNGRMMRSKTRIFILDEEQASLMEEDLANQEILDLYWNKSQGVRSFWVRQSELKALEPFITKGLCTNPFMETPADFALYDGQLLIAFDPQNSILTFDVVAPDSPFKAIFAKPGEWTQRGRMIFRPVPVTASPPS